MNKLWDPLLIDLLMRPIRSPYREPFNSNRQKAREDLESIIYRTKKFYGINDGEVINILENIKELWEWKAK